MHISDITKSIMITKLAVLSLAIGCMLSNAAQWDFKDGDNSSIIREKTNPALNGRINDLSLCNWAREDDRDWFMTFKEGGSVIIPHSDSLNFDKGFTAHIHFSCDMSNIGRNDLVNLFSKGNNLQPGYSLMLRKDGVLILNLKGFEPERHPANIGIASNIEYLLSIYAGKEEVRIFLNNKEVESYPVTGNLQMKDNKEPLYIGSVQGHDFSGNIYSFSITPYEPPPVNARSDTAHARAKKPEELPVSDPPGTVIVNDFSKFDPPERVILSSTFSTSSFESWVLRHVTFMAQSDSVLHPPISPDSVISFHPGLTGEYDVYVSLRAVSTATALQFNLSNDETWYRLETEPVGNAHRNIEFQIARSINMDDVQIRLASNAAPAYLGNIKFVPSASTKEWRMDPVGKVTAGSKLTAAKLYEQREKEVANRIADGYFKELNYVEKRSVPTPGAVSVNRGYILFEQPWMELLFKNSAPPADSARLELKTSFAPGEFEPLTLGLRAIDSLRNVRLRMSKPFFNGITAEIAVVEAIPKRTSNYRGRSEFINAPQYLEKNHVIDIEADQTRQFWITLHASGNTPPGIYQAEFELVSNTNVETIPVTARIHDLKLRPVEGYDIGFWVGFGGMDRQSIEQTIKTMIDHGMTSLVTDHFFTLTGDSPENYAIDFSASTATIVGEACRKYNLRGNMIVAVDALNRGKAFTRLVKEFDAYAEQRHWPPRIYTTYDEVPSHPHVFDAFTESIKVLHEAGFRVMADHIWYKTSRPLQKEVDLATPYIDVFVNRFNTRRLFYVDSWEEMETECINRGKNLYAYNSTNALTFAQAGAMRFAGGWFFRSFGRGTIGHLFCAFNKCRNNPYTELDGDTSDWLYVYPPQGKRKGGPAIDFVAFREGVDDLRYILTLEHEISAARENGFTADADAADSILDRLKNSFDKQRFYEESIFFDSKWSHRKINENGRIEVSGELNIPNGWNSTDYAFARDEMAAAIVKLQKVNRN